MGHLTSEIEPVLKYLKAGWGFALGSSSMRMEAPDEEIGSDALEGDDFEWIAAAWGIDVIVGWSGCSQPARIEATAAQQSRLDWLKSILHSQGQNMNLTQIDPSRDADLARELLSNEFAGAIVRQDTQDVLLVNQQLISESDKPVEVWQGKSITPLWDDDELTRVLTFLGNDQNLTDFEYAAYRWSKELGSPIWKREKHRFVADMKLVTFLGIPCRMTFTKQAEQVRTSRISV